MSDPFGFKKNRTRETLPLRNINERIGDYNDTHKVIEVNQEREIATCGSARCMDCGVPFCHFSCPLGNLIPEWNDLVYNKQWKLASDRLHSTNNFPEFTGRVCPALCEQGCVLGSIDPAVTIKNTEVTISDVAFNRGYLNANPSDYSSGYTIGIVGSGPAGLAAAQQLIRAGHTVVVYEKNDKPGGLLRYGIPNFKLEKSIIDRRINQLEAEGVRFRCNIRVGGNGENDVSWKYLYDRFDIVLIAIGTEMPNDLPVNGRQLNNVHFAMEYLTNSTKSVLDENYSNKITASNKNVLIIGGGDTGSDCLGTALRQNAGKVTTLQVMPEPSDKRDGSEFYGKQPWPTYPTLNTSSTSVEEGQELGKSEILYQTTVVELLGDENNDVKSAILAKVKWEKGKFEILEDTKYEIPVDLVLISIGFKGANTNDLVAELKVEIDERCLVKRDKNYQTNIDKVFVCGDAGRGQSLVVWAIAEGRSVAKAIDEYLTGETELIAPIKSDEVALRA